MTLNAIFIIVVVQKYFVCQSQIFFFTMRFFELMRLNIKPLNKLQGLLIIKD
jgi:hypothetical protein